MNKFERVIAGVSAAKSKISRWRTGEVQEKTAPMGRIIPSGIEAEISISISDSENEATDTTNEANNKSLDELPRGITPQEGSQTDHVENEDPELQTTEVSPGVEADSKGNVKTPVTEMEVIADADSHSTHAPSKTVILTPGLSHPAPIQKMGEERHVPLNNQEHVHQGDQEMHATQKGGDVIQDQPSQKSVMIPSTVRGLRRQIHELQNEKSEWNNQFEDIKKGAEYWKNLYYINKHKYKLSTERVRELEQLKVHDHDTSQQSQALAIQKDALEREEGTNKHTIRELQQIIGKQREELQLAHHFSEEDIVREWKIRDYILGLIDIRVWKANNVCQHKINELETKMTEMRAQHGDELRLLCSLLEKQLIAEAELSRDNIESQYFAQLHLGLHHEQGQRQLLESEKKMQSLKSQVRLKEYENKKLTRNNLILQKSLRDVNAKRQKIKKLKMEDEERMRGQLEDQMERYGVLATKLRRERDTTVRQRAQIARTRVERDNLQSQIQSLTIELSESKVHLEKVEQERNDMEIQYVAENKQVIQLGKQYHNLSIAAITIGSCLGFVVIVLLILFLLRIRRNKRRSVMQRVDIQHRESPAHSSLGSILNGSHSRSPVSSDSSWPRRKTMYDEFGFVHTWQEWEERKNRKKKHSVREAETVEPADVNEEDVDIVIGDTETDDTNAAEDKSSTNYGFGLKEEKASAPPLKGDSLWPLRSEILHKFLLGQKQDTRKRATVEPETMKEEVNDIVIEIPHNKQRVE